MQYLENILNSLPNLKYFKKYNFNFKIVKYC